MRDVMRYSGIVTKVAAMRAKLLKPQDYEQLASMDTVTDIIEYLKQTKSYGKFITQMDESLYHRGNIEKVLIQSLYDDYTRLYRFADMQQKDFLKIFMKRYEVDLVRYCLRIVFNHSNVPFDLNRRSELLGGISLLSPEYLLSFERRSFHTHPPDHYAPVSCLLGMSASQSSALMPLHSLRSVTNRPEGTFGSLRYAFGGDHPSQTTHQAVSAYHALDLRQPKGRISRMAPRKLALPLRSLRPILHIG